MDGGRTTVDGGRTAGGAFKPGDPGADAEHVRGARAEGSVAAVVGIAAGLAVPALAGLTGTAAGPWGTAALAGLAGTAAGRLVSRRVETARTGELVARLDGIRARLAPAASGLVAPARAGRVDPRVEAALDRLLGEAKAVHRSVALADTPGDVVVVLGRDGRVEAVSESSSATLGWRPDQLHGQPFAGLVHGADLAAFAGLVDGVLVGSGSPSDRVRVRVRSARDEWYVLELSTPPAPPERGSLVLAGRDVTDQARVEEELRHRVAHDVLTGLPNRDALLRLADDAVAVAGPELPLSVLIIDLDRFKEINDSLGHAVGDQLLAQVGPRLREALRPLDTIARVGGDEFAVLLPTAGQDGAHAVAGRLAAALEAPIVVAGMDLHLESSIGIAVSHRDGREETLTVQGLLREAEIAMYRAKQDGNAIATFDPERDGGQSRYRLELFAELRRAITHAQLVLHYQPVVDVLEGGLAGVEALVRWQHPDRGLIPPADFLPLAEQTGLIVPLSRVVLAAAVEQAALWARAGTPVQIAVNMSPRWLLHDDVPQLVDALLEEHGVPAELLRLEITESVVLVQPENALETLTRLRDRGIGLSLDDFGTGYSSMTHLRNLPVDELKVDRGFVHAMTTSPQDAVIVRAAVELGRKLGLEVVAEGIEDAATLAEVVAAGCALAQGYYFARPMPAQDLITWAKDRFPRFGLPDAAPATRRVRVH